MVRRKLAVMSMEIEMARQWAYWVSWKQSSDPWAFSEPSAAKYFLTEMMVRMSTTAVEIMGLYGTLKQDSKWAPLKGKFESMCQATLGFTIAGGSSETQKNIIAWMGLGLPRMK